MGETGRSMTEKHGVGPRPRAVGACADAGVASAGDGCGAGRQRVTIEDAVAVCELHSADPRMGNFSASIDRGRWRRRRRRRRPTRGVGSGAAPPYRRPSALNSGLVRLLIALHPRVG